MVLNSRSTVIIELTHFIYLFALYFQMMPKRGSV